jgi:SAM-dependent methyltransferase
MTGASVTHYDELGSDYNRTRGPDPRIAQLIREALGDAGSVIDVGAGTGAYEPTDRPVLAVEPSAAMRAARPPGAAPAIDGCAESLPVSDKSFDAALAVLTMQHWRNVRSGLAELRRVARRRVVLFTWDPEFTDALWFTVHYLPAIRDRDRACFPTLSAITGVLGELQVTPVPIPHDCTDGFLGSRWRRPNDYLDPVVRAGMSGFSRAPRQQVDEALGRLRADLRSGAWERRFGSLRSLEEMDLGYRLVVAELAP